MAHLNRVSVLTDEAFEAVGFVVKDNTIHVIVPSDITVAQAEEVQEYLEGCVAAMAEMTQHVRIGNLSRVTTPLEDNDVSTSAH